MKHKAKALTPQEVEANRSSAYEYLNIGEMELWEKISNKMLPKVDLENEKELMEWYKKTSEENQRLIDEYGELSWEIDELSRSLDNEKISNSKFRELVRYVVDQNFKKKLIKLIGKVNKDEHPDEINCRAENWLQERRNWITEVSILRAELENEKSNHRR